jgi:hypothetical protein
MLEEIIKAGFDKITAETNSIKLPTKKDKRDKKFESIITETTNPYSTSPSPPLSSQSSNKSRW